MVVIQVEFTTSVLFLLLILIPGICRVVESSEIEKCNLTADVLDCSSRGLYSVPQIENVNASFPLKFNLSSNYISIDSFKIFYFIYGWTDHHLYVSELYLDHNRIEYIPPETLNPVHTTEIVDLSWNQMKAVPDKLFSSIRELKRLSLAGNPIAELDITLSPTLEELDISSCNLSSLGERMLAGLHLKSLDISNNSLTAVNWSLVDSATSVKMDGNPWDCSTLWRSKPEFASLQEQCTTTTGPATTTTKAVTVADVAAAEASTTTEREQSVATKVPEELLWSSFGIVEGVLVGWFVYLLLLGSAAWLRARSLQRGLDRDGNWWLEPRL